jgi:hypothetical protein
MMTISNKICKNYIKFITSNENADSAAKEAKKDQKENENNDRLFQSMKCVDHLGDLNPQPEGEEHINASLKHSFTISPSWEKEKSIAAKMLRFIKTTPLYQEKLQNYVPAQEKNTKDMENRLLIGSQSNNMINGAESSLE